MNSARYPDTEVFHVARADKKVSSVKTTTVRLRLPVGLCVYSLRNSCGDVKLPNKDKVSAMTRVTKLPFTIHAQHRMGGQGAETPLAKRHQKHMVRGESQPRMKKRSNRPMLHHASDRMEEQRDRGAQKESNRKPESYNNAQT